MSYCIARGEIHSSAGASGGFDGASDAAPRFRDAVFAAAGAAFDALFREGGAPFSEATEVYREAQDAWAVLERRRSFAHGCERL
jgi:hypothetical protein